jgi:asparagine synthase (glutamine-hydrolysing)
MSLASFFRQLIYPVNDIVKLIPKNSSILDIGCGNANILNNLKNTNFVNYTGIDPKLKMIRNGSEKYLLRKSFEDLLPEEIIWRRKDGFSDGVSSLDKPWYEVINDYTTKLYNMNEKDYYKSIFSNYYKGYEYIVPYEWLPKWCNETNPSGRLL